MLCIRINEKDEHMQLMEEYEKIGDLWKYILKLEEQIHQHVCQNGLY